MYSKCHAVRDEILDLPRVAYICDAGSVWWSSLLIAGETDQHSHTTGLGTSSTVDDEYGM
jgi:hypothetical protein